MHTLLKRLVGGGIAALSLVLAGCRSGDRAEFIAQVDAAPADRRPPDWERTKRLMARRAPGVGEVAPDFTLPLPGGGEITRSSLQDGRPLVLIFGSFT